MRKELLTVNFSGIVFTLLCSLFPWKGYALEIPFIPPVDNYTTSHYKAGNQNWSIAQDQEGVIYNQTTYELRALNKGVEYHFAIEAFNENGISAIKRPEI